MSGGGRESATREGQLGTDEQRARRDGSTRCGHGRRQSWRESEAVSGGASQSREEVGLVEAKLQLWGMSTREFLAGPCGRRWRSERPSLSDPSLLSRPFRTGWVSQCITVSPDGGLGLQ